MVVTEILRFALDDKMMGKFYYDTTLILFRGFPCFPKVISTGSCGLQVAFSGMFVNDNHHLVYRHQRFRNITVYPFQQFHDFAMHIQCIRKVLLPINKADGFVVVDSVPEFSDLNDSCIDV